MEHKNRSIHFLALYISIQDNMIYKESPPNLPTSSTPIPIVQ